MTEGLSPGARLRAVALATLALALTAAPSARGQETGTPIEVDLELVIAVDVSGSMDREEFILQRRGYSEAIRHPNFIAAIRAGLLQRIAVTYVEWSGTRQQKVVVPWRVIDGLDTAEKVAAELDRQPLVIARGTSISAAVTFSAGLFQANGYESERQVIDVSGDGPNNYGPPIVAARDEVVETGIVINGLPILIRPSPLTPDIVRYYSDCVIGGPGSFVLPVQRVAEFALAIRRKLILELVGISHDGTIPVQAAAPVDCLIGEKMRERYADPYLPGLDD